MPSTLADKFIEAAKQYSNPIVSAAKEDAGKPKLTLVPTQIIFDIEKIRQYGNKKYHDPNNWKDVDRERYFEAFLRHTLAMWKNGMDAIDPESGLPHAAHAACNLAFMAELREPSIPKAAEFLTKRLCMPYDLEGGPILNEQPMENEKKMEV